LLQPLVFQLSLANTITISVQEDEVPRSFSKELSATNIEERGDLLISGEKHQAKISKEGGGESERESPCPPSQVPFPGHLCLDFDDVYNSAYKFLEEQLPSWDKTNAASLGFHSGAPGVDGLDLGVATLGINISIATKQARSWAYEVPEDIFYEYVVTYAHANEARSNWRPFLTEVVGKILNGSSQGEPKTVAEVVKLINSQLWSSGLLGNVVTFKSSQTPLIYDPMSTIVFGYASCTGVSILFADALRAAGVPARLAGTPAWNGSPSNGNHNWIEVYDASTGQWHFIEALVAGTGESLENPCDKWFCNPASMATGTQVFATRWKKAGTVYPMAWDLANTEVSGVNRTEYYQSVCNLC